MHKPTDETRQQVKDFVLAGIPQDNIGLVLDITAKTLRKYYKSEINSASTVATSKVAGELYIQCMNGNVTAQIFWMKTRGKWSETQPINPNEDKVEKVTINIVDKSKNADRG